MKQKINEQLEIPSGITCEYSDSKIVCKKDSNQLSKYLHIPSVTISISDGKINFNSEKANKNVYKVVKANIAHIKNIFNGLTKEFVYQLEACNVHFPMTLKIDSNNLVINNFLGEKVPRKAKILSGVKVDLKGQKITLTSNNKEAAGHTAANIEKATKIRNRDRRIFQDGIFIVERPGAAY